MSTLRDHCSTKQMLAHSILDRLKAGENIDQSSVLWALATLGEPVGG